MDQFITTYQHDYLWRDITCPMGGHRLRLDASADPNQVPCKPKAHVGEAVGRPYENPLGTCPCAPGGSMPPRGAVANGLPTNLDKACGCRPGGAPAAAQRAPTFTKEEMAEMMYKAAETGNLKTTCTPCQNVPDLNPLRPPPQQAAGGCTRPPTHVTKPLPCPQQCSHPEKFRPVPQGQFGGQYEGPLNRDVPDSAHPDQSQPYKYDNPCLCPPPKPESGPLDYGPAWIREKARDEPAVEPRMMGGASVSVPPDVARMVNPEPPAARVSCAPETDISKFDQPNTFMRKLYEKYPYLYQILRDTPPEELIARVFKDRFLSTYQVDYLHMGIGKEVTPKGGEQPGEKFKSPEGEAEPAMIPGCKYRSSQKGDFGKKKSTLKMKSAEDAEEDTGFPDAPVKEEPRISEYMASISKLGGEIISDKLFQLEAVMRKQSSGKGT